MITHSIKVLFGCDEDGSNLVSTSEIVKVFVVAGFDVETGVDIIIVRRREKL